MNKNKRKVLSLVRAKRHSQDLETTLEGLPSVDMEKMNEILDIILSLESGIKRRYHIRRLERLFFPQGAGATKPKTIRTAKRKSKGRSAESIALFGK